MVTVAPTSGASVAASSTVPFMVALTIGWFCAWAKNANSIRPELIMVFKNVFM
ncbi:hypothetical protein D3C86_1935200 [compost metagenome]